MHSYDYLVDRIEQAIIDMKANAVAAGGAAPVLDSVWRGLQNRCHTIIRRIRCVEAMPVPPRAFCCNIMPDRVMTDPVVTMHGFSYDRENLERHIAMYSKDPLSGLPLTANDFVTNHSLRDAIDYHNAHYMRFAVPLHLPES